jgi:DnaJ-class molecular chaperone
MSSTCPACGGRGVVIDRAAKCTSCSGQGRIRTTKELEVSIPAGIDDGMRVRLAGQGDAPLEGDGRPGDLLLQVHVVVTKIGSTTCKVYQRWGDSIARCACTTNNRYSRRNGNGTHY